MDRFTTALISKYTLKIPVKDDWFAPLVGDWDIRCVDAMCRETKGEWFFRRVLGGTGIEDLRLCSAMQPECAVTLRLYRADEGCYDAARSGEEGINRFRFTKENGKIIGANLDIPGEMHVFSEIRSDYFKWERVTVLENKTWRTDCTIFASRKRN